MNNRSLLARLAKFSRAGQFALPGAAKRKKQREIDAIQQEIIDAAAAKRARRAQRPQGRS